MKQIFVDERWKIHTDIYFSVFYPSSKSLLINLKTKMILITKRVLLVVFVICAIEDKNLLRSLNIAH